MSFNLVQILSHMGPLGMVIAGFLILMAIACVGVVVERWLALGRSARESRLFADKAPELIDDWRLDELCALTDRYKASALARVFGAVIRRYERAVKQTDAEGAVELARNEAERVKEATGAELRRGLNVLATTGSIAPFIGLLGTVVGIIAAFQGIAASGSGGIGAISAGIAEALIETALGLLVAIPAVLLFNFLTARINAVDLALARSAGELIDEMEVHHGVKPERKKLAATA
jgi:biopolymer transport protein ExbB